MNGGITEMGDMGNILQRFCSLYGILIEFWES